MFLFTHNRTRTNNETKEIPLNSHSLNFLLSRCTTHKQELRKQYTLVEAPQNRIPNSIAVHMEFSWEITRRRVNQARTRNQTAKYYPMDTNNNMDLVSPIVHWHFPLPTLTLLIYRVKSLHSHYLSNPKNVAQSNRCNHSYANH